MCPLPQPRASCQATDELVNQWNPGGVHRMMYSLWQLPSGDQSNGNYIYHMTYGRISPYIYPLPCAADVLTVLTDVRLRLSSSTVDNLYLIA